MRLVAQRVHDALRVEETCVWQDWRSYGEAGGVYVYVKGLREFNGFAVGMASCRLISHDVQLFELDGFNVLTFIDIAIE